MTETKHNVLAQVDTVAPKSMMHPLVERMLAKDPTPESLEKILKLQSDWEKAESKRAFDAALVELKRALPHFLAHDKQVEFGGKVQYTHTTLAGAMEIVTPILVDHGFSLTWTPGNDGKGGVQVTCELSHRLGHTKVATLVAPPDGSGHKNPAQAIASTVTILERYTALGLLGLSTKDMGEIGVPAAAPNAEKVDTARNMRAMSDLAKSGKNKETVERYLGKPLAQWTTADLDKLRKWIDPAPATAPKAPPADVVITNAQIDIIKALRLQWKLTPDQMGELITETIGRHPASAKDIKNSEYEKLNKVFEGLESGAFTLKDGKIVRPPAEEEAAPEYPKESPEDAHIPF